MGQISLLVRASQQGLILHWDSGRSADLRLERTTRQLGEDGMRRLDADIARVCKALVARRFAAGEAWRSDGCARRSSGMWSRYSQCEAEEILNETTNRRIYIMGTSRRLTTALFGAFIGLSAFANEPVISEAAIAANSQVQVVVLVEAPVAPVTQSADPSAPICPQAIAAVDAAGCCAAKAAALAGAICTEKSDACPMANAVAQADGHCTDAAQVAAADSVPVVVAIEADTYDLSPMDSMAGTILASASMDGLVVPLVIAEDEAVDTASEPSTLVADLPQPDTAVNDQLATSQESMPVVVTEPVASQELATPAVTVSPAAAPGIPVSESLPQVAVQESEAGLPVKPVVVEGEDSAAAVDSAAPVESVASIEEAKLEAERLMTVIQQLRTEAEKLNQDIQTLRTQTRGGESASLTFHDGISGLAQSWSAPDSGTGGALL